MPVLPTLGENNPSAPCVYYRLLGNQCRLLLKDLCCDSIRIYKTHSSI